MTWALLLVLVAFLAVAKPQLGKFQVILFNMVIKFSKNCLVAGEFYMVMMIMTTALPILEPTMY